MINELYKEYQVAVEKADEIYEEQRKLIDEALEKEPSLKNKLLVDYPQEVKDISELWKKACSVADDIETKIADIIGERNVYLISDTKCLLLDYDGHLEERNYIKGQECS